MNKDLNVVKVASSAYGVLKVKFLKIEYVL